MDIFIYNRFRLSSSLDFLPPSLQYLRKNRLWLIGKPFPRCRETQKPRMNMDSNMKLSHLSFRNHCIFRSLNNFSSQGQFFFFFFFFLRINRGAFFSHRTISLFFSFLRRGSLFHNYFFDREYLVPRHDWIKFQLHRICY